MEKPKTVNPLADVEKFSGEFEGRIGPVILFICVSAIPFLLYAYYLIGRLPFSVYLLIQVFWIIRWALIIIGKEKERMIHFRSQIYDQFSQVSDLMDIKNIVEKDGCVIYKNGTIAYMAVSANSNVYDSIRYSQVLRKFLVSISSECTPDVVVLNVAPTDELYKMYTKIKKIGNDEVCLNYIEIIDANINKIENESLLNMTVFVLRGRKEDYKKIKESLDKAVNSSASKIFKEIVVADKDLTEKLISLDIGTYIDYVEINRKKYSKGNYYGSKVLSYDDEDILNIKEESEDERGFMIND